MRSNVFSSLCVGDLTDGRRSREDHIVMPYQQQIGLRGGEANQVTHQVFPADLKCSV